MNFPLGHTTGKPFDRELQMKIIKDAFDALKSIKEPGTIIDLPYQWEEGDDSWEPALPSHHLPLRFPLPAIVTLFPLVG